MTPLHSEKISADIHRSNLPSEWFLAQVRGRRESSARDEQVLDIEVAMAALRGGDSFIRQDSVSFSLLDTPGPNEAGAPPLPRIPTPAPLSILHPKVFDAQPKLQIPTLKDMQPPSVCSPFHPLYRTSTAYIARRVLSAFNWLCWRGGGGGQ